MDAMLPHVAYASADPRGPQGGTVVDERLEDGEIPAIGEAKRPTVLPQFQVRGLAQVMPGGTFSLATCALATLPAREDTDPVNVQAITGLNEDAPQRLANGQIPRLPLGVFDKLNHGIAPEVVSPAPTRWMSGVGRHSSDRMVTPGTFPPVRGAACPSWICPVHWRTGLRRPVAHWQRHGLRP